MKTFKNGLAAAAIALAGMTGAAQAATVDTVLSLVIDVSGSINTTEYNQQMDGYAAAFRDATIQAGILDTGGGDLGKIAVNVVQFGTRAAEQVAFTILDSIASIDAFADTLDTLARASLGASTCIACGIDVGKSTISTWLAGNTASRGVIDVSGDGGENVRTIAQLKAARDAACGTAGIDAVNGITIGGGASLLAHYNDNVICGSGSFAIGATGFSTFESAIKTKLNAEITGTSPVPVPASALFMFTAMGAAFVARRRKSKS